MSTRATVWAIFLLILISIAGGIYLYPQFPDPMVGHWNAAGDANGTIPKFWGLFLMPIIAFALGILFYLIPKMDPLRGNIERFRGWYNTLIVAVVVFLFYVHALTLFWNAGSRINMSLALAPAMGALFFLIGAMLPHTERNWFVGVRTPWTLSSDAVWKKTHVFGGKLFELSGVIALVGIFFPRAAILFIIVPVLVAALGTVIYSYVLFRQIEKGSSPP